MIASVQSIIVGYRNVSLQVYLFVVVYKLVIVVLL